MDRKTFLLSIAGGAACSPFAAACRSHRQSAPAAAGSSKGRQLADRIVADTNAAYFVAAAYIGDRLGLSRRLASAGRCTAEQLARESGFSQRYVLEWLRAMAAAGYIDYHAEPEAFEMPPEHAAVLVDENSPLFSAGLIEATVPDILMSSRVMAAFRSGEGIAYGSYPPETFEGIERLTRPDYLHRLAGWIGAVPGVPERLRAGGSAADLGCGAGHALIALAKAFPQAKGFGFDPYEPSVRRARENAASEGVAGRVAFAGFDGVHVPGGPYDLITICHSLHHAGDPVGLLRSAGRSLSAGGAFFIIEERRAARLAEDINSPRAGYYGSSLLECLPTALAEGGPGFGTGISEPDVRALARESGFGRVERVLADDPLLSFFVLRV